jgi:hypothetical protein
MPVSSGGSSDVGTPAAECSIAGQASWPSATACLPAPDSPLVGKWKGQWPWSVTPSSPDVLPAGGEVLLDIQGMTAEGVPCGYFSVGEGAASLPPATSATQDYPPGLNIAVEAPNVVEKGPFAGYRYPITQVVSSGSRLSFTVPKGDPWRSWCALQTPVGNTGSCFAHHSWIQTPEGCSAGGQEVNCMQAQLCGGVSRVCYCSDSCCDAQPEGGMQLELHWDGDALEGSVGSALLFLDPVE